MTRRWTMRAAALSALLLLAGSAAAGQRILGLQDQAVISSPSNAQRFLIRFESFEDLQDELLLSATIHVRLDGGTLRDDLEMSVGVPQTAWTSAATWEQPWTVPGGDPYGGLGADCSLRAGASGFTGDVTHLVRAMQREDVLDHGFLVQPGGGRREGFSVPEMRALAARGQVFLEISYMDLDGQAEAAMRRARERDRLRAR